MPSLRTLTSPPRMRLFPTRSTLSTFGGSFTALGGEDDNWPQGRNVTNYQFSDDVSITRGRHSFQFGAYFRRDDVTDYSPSIDTTPFARSR